MELREPSGAGEKRHAIKDGTVAQLRLKDANRRDGAVAASISLFRRGSDMLVVARRFYMLRLYVFHTVA